MKNYKLKSQIILKFGTQYEFAKTIGMREDRLSKIIHGRELPTQKEMEIISRTLETEPAELFG